MQPIFPYTSNIQNVSPLQQIEIPDKTKLVVIKTAQNGQPVEFYYDRDVSIHTAGQYIKKEDLPNDLKSITSKEALSQYLQDAYLNVKNLSNGDKKVNISQRILGGGKELMHPGHGVTYIILNRNEDIDEIELKLTDNDQKNTIIFGVDRNGATLRYQQMVFSSALEFPQQHPKRIMGRLCLQGNRLSSDQRYWVSVDSNNGKVSCGFGEVSEISTLCTMKIEKSPLQGIRKAKFRGNDSQGNSLKEIENRLVMEGLIKGGALIVDDGKLSVAQNEIKTVNLLEPVKQLMTEMTAVEREIERKYGEDIWDEIQQSLDSGILREMVEEKKQSIDHHGGSLQQNQVYVRIGFGDNYKGGPGHRMVIELWPAGHESPIHQHSLSYSYIKIMRGDVFNTNYPILSDCEIGRTPIAQSVLQEGARTWLSPQQNQVHKIENRTPKGVISFHGYRYGDQGSQELCGVFDLIDKEGRYKEGGAVISHWDSFALSHGYPPGIEGFLTTIRALAIGTGLNIEGTCTTQACPQYQKKSIRKIGFGSYELADIVFHSCCPSCQKILHLEKIILKNCRYTIQAKNKISREIETITHRISGNLQNSFDITQWFSASINIEQ